MVDINAIESIKDDQDDGRKLVVENTHEEQTEQEKIDDGGVNPMTAIHIVYIMPFFLKFSSTIPPIYLSVALKDDFGASGPVSGMVMALFQIARAVVIGITMYSPDVSICFGSSFGVLGFICLAVYPTWEDKTYALALFSAANILIGLTNAFSALQVFAKREYSTDLKGLRFALRRQSVVSGAACLCSYFSSGILYDKLGIEWIGIVGCLAIGIGSVSLFLYLVGRKPLIIEDEEEASESLTNDTNPGQFAINSERPGFSSTRPRFSTWQSFYPGHSRRDSSRPYLPTTDSTKPRLSRWQSIKASFVEVQETDLDRHFQAVEELSKLVVPGDQLETIEDNDDEDDENESLPFKNNLGTIEEKYNENESLPFKNNLGTIEEKYNKNESLPIKNNLGTIEKKDNKNQSSNVRDSTIGNQGKQRFLSSTLNFQLQNTMVSNKDLATENQERVLSKFSGAEEVALNQIVFVIASAFTIEALTSGSLFAVGPLYIKEAFGRSTSQTGTIFTISSVFGTVFTALFISDKGREIVRKLLPSSSEIYLLMLIISVSTLVLIGQSFPAQVVSIIFVIGFNETLWVLLTELEGSITTEKFYLTIGPAALLLHKVINTIVSFVCPILINVKTWLPYALSGGIALTFSIFFALRFEIQRYKNARFMAEVVAEKRMTVAQAKAIRMSFTTLEILSRMASVKKKREKGKMNSISLRGGPAVQGSLRGGPVVQGNSTVEGVPKP